jgi:DNA-binding HxlR family transcriptional regulator
MGGMAEGDDLHRACNAELTLAFSVLGKRWNGVILDVLAGGPLSFVQLRRTVTGISDAVLSDRLGELASAELVVRDVQPGPPVAVTYALTESAERLIPVLGDLADWAATNLAQRA